MRRTEIERLLPGVFQRTIHPGNPLLGLLEAMEELHAPSEDELLRLDASFDPRRTADAFVPFLARWVDLDRLFDEPAGRDTPYASSRIPLSTGLGRLRELAASAAYLSQWRGTAKGFVLFLETATGASGFEVDERVTDERGRARPFHLRIQAPAETAAHRPLIERIIEFEKPAYVTYELLFETAKTAGA